MLGKRVAEIPLLVQKEAVNDLLGTDSLPQLGISLVVMSRVGRWLDFLRRLNPLLQETASKCLSQRNMENSQPAS